MNESNEEQTEKKRPPALSTGRIILILLIIAAAVELMVAVSDIIYARMYGSYGYDYGEDMDYYFGGAGSSERGGIIYLTDDEARAEGKECTELAHFDITAESLIDDIYSVLDEEGLDVDYTDTSSFNQAYGDGGSWYETLMTFWLSVPGDDTSYQRLTLNYDTATGALHEIDIFISDEDRAMSLSQAIRDLLDEKTDERVTSELYCFEEGFSIYIGRE